MRISASKHSTKLILSFISLVLAVIVWFYVGNVSVVKVERTLPIKYKLPSDMTFFEPPIKTIKVVVKGPALFIRKLDTENYSVEVTIPESNSKERYSLQKSVEDLPILLPIGVERVSVTPLTLNLEVDYLIKKSIPVTLVTNGHLLPGLRLKEKKIVPATVVVEGPKSRLKDVTSIETAPVKLDELVKSSFNDLPLLSLHPSIHVSTKSIRFDYDIEKGSSTISAKSFPIKFEAGRFAFIPSARNVSLLLTIPEGANRAAIMKRVKVIAKVPSKKNGKVEVELKVELPDDVTLSKIKPSSIIIKY